MAEELQKEIIDAVGEENVPKVEVHTNSLKSTIRTEGKGEIETETEREKEEKVFETNSPLVISSSTFSTTSSPHPDGGDFASSTSSTSLSNDVVVEKGPFVKSGNVRSLPINVTFSTRQKRKK